MRLPEWSPAIFKTLQSLTIVSKFWRLEFHLRLSIIWMAPSFSDFTSPLTLHAWYITKYSTLFFRDQWWYICLNLLLHLEGGS